ncbi:MAG: TonB-dependent receptor [Dysgonamonadaceae bacterium]|jgi:TonB-linked SusC/RagA family outer membrane protein|nr:TonB-dependent receptor [Dysgonamonadaceae bacterium]
MSAQITVSGVVSDEKGDALIGVSVVEKGTDKGVVTDLDGHYSLTVESNATLVFSYIGYISQSIGLKNINEKGYKLDVVLQEKVSNLDEVVVIGYGTVKKRDLTGAVSSIKASDIDLTASASIGHALKGKAAGLSVIQNSAQPGGGLDILIRGAGSVNASNTPLYIVDGFPIARLDQLGSNNDLLDAGTQGVLNFINPADIASIEILKDASATAIYGARAANGVVLITTKRGSEGKTSINYGFSYGIQKHSNIFDLYNLKEWMTARNNASWDRWMFENSVYPYGTKTLEQAMALPVNGLKYKLPYTDAQIENAGEGTDWIGLITRQGMIHQHNLSIQGGSAQTKFLLSFNYFDQQGIIKNSDLQRYTGKLNVDHTINDYLSVGVNLLASRTDNNNRALGNERYEKSGLLRAAVQMGPHIQAIDENGNYPLNPELGTQPNPYSLLNVKDVGRMDRILANSFLTVKPLKDLSVKLNAGMDIASQERNTYMPKSTLHGYQENGDASITQGVNEQYLLEATANYVKTVANEHKIGFLAGVSYEKFNSRNHYLSNKDFITDAFEWKSMQSGTGAKSMSSSAEENKMQSFFTRINYTLLDRYLLTATFRADGASVFARNHKWGYFPSIAAAWNVTEESFMESLRSKLSILKARISYGQTGNSDIGGNAFAAYYATPAWNMVDKNKIIGVFQNRLENPNLKWETTTETNIGLDFGVFGGRISGTLEFYNRVISDLLNYKDLNTYHDISRVIANIGKTQSRGFEATVNTKNIVGKNFNWDTDFTFSTYKDRWLERTGDWKPTVYQNVNDPIRAIYSRIGDHILQMGETPPASQPELLPGQIVIKDLDGYVRDEFGDPVVENGRFLRTGKPDGIIDEADVQLLGTTDPGFIMGMNNRFRWKNFDFSFDLNGLFDRIMVDPTYMELGTSDEGIAQYGYNGLRILDKRWTPENPSDVYPSSFYTRSRYGYGDWFYQKAWFIRLQNVSLGYTIPLNPALKKAFENIRIYINANNLYVFTPYTGLDPETDVYTAAYPNARTYTFGIDIRF